MIRHNSNHIADNNSASNIINKHNYTIRRQIQCASDWSTIHLHISRESFQGFLNNQVSTVCHRKGLYGIRESARHTTLIEKTKDLT